MDKTGARIGLRQTSEPWPEPVVVAIKEPVQDAGEDGAVVVGHCLLLSRLAEPERDGQK